MPPEKLFLLLWTEFAIIGKAHVFAARNEIEEVFLQICAGTGDRMHLVLSNHLRQRNAQLSGAHGAGEGDHHFPTAIEVRDVGVGSVFQNRRVEVPVMTINKLTDGAHFHFGNCLQSAVFTSMQKTYSAAVKR